MLPQARAVLVPCLSRGDVRLFAPGDSADPRYGTLFRQAMDAGVEVLPCRYRFAADGVRWEGVAPVLREQPHGNATPEEPQPGEAPVPKDIP